MSPPPYPTSQSYRAGRLVVRGRGRAAISARSDHSSAAALRGAAVRGIGVSLASATSTDEAPFEDSQSPFESLTGSRFCIPLLFAKDCYVGTAERILSQRLEDVISERDSPAHTLNNIEVFLQKASQELRAVKIEKKALIENVTVIQAELRVYEQRETVSRFSLSTVQCLIRRRNGRGN